MPWFLRQSTASQEVMLGPFVSDTDGKTAQTALSIANTDIKVFKTGATSEASKNSGGATHISAGRYYCVLDATDTDTIGPLRLSVQVAGALPVWADCCVLSAAVYDSLFGSTALTTGDVMGRLGAPAGASVSADIASLTTVAVLRNSAATGGAAGSITLDSGASATDNLYRGLAVLHVPTGQVRLITGYTGSTKVATVAPNWTTNPANGDAFRLLPWNAVDVQQIKTTTSAGAAGYVGVDWSAINAPTTTVNLSGTTIGTVSTLAANSVNASALATDAVTEIQTGLATSTAVAAIKAKTDLMSFSPGNKLIVCIAEMYDNVGEYWPTGVTDPGYLHVEIRSSTTNSIGVGAIAANSITNATIANGALTSAKFSVSSITGVASGILEQIVQLWRLFFKKSNLDLNAAQLKTYADDGTTVLTTQTVTPSGTSQTRGAAT